jgi:hypothetical protein
MVDAAFWQDDTRFYIRGVDYQPGGSSEAADPLADPKVCKRDIEQFKTLGINTIRVYITDNAKDHDICMNALADAGIYVILDANNPKYSISRLNPDPSYNEVYLQSVFATIDAFAKYPNTLAFFSGNEVVNDQVDSTLSARYVKATTRDMRQYIGNRGYRKIPVGYSAADVASNRRQLADYMNCGTDDERSDFFAFVGFREPQTRRDADNGRMTIRGVIRPTLSNPDGSTRLRTLPTMVSPSCKCRTWVKRSLTDMVCTACQNTAAIRVDRVTLESLPRS